MDDVNAQGFSVETRPGNCRVKASLKITNEAAREFGGGSIKLFAAAWCGVLNQEVTYGKHFGCTHMVCQNYLSQSDLAAAAAKLKT
ncbi:MAG: hypothetical protein Q7S31_00920 [bacterium]|nr:hypothetical protein [bacterium]